MRSVRFFAAVLAVSVVLAPVAGAEPTEVGTTAATNTDTTGTPPRMATRNLFIGTNVFFEERIETSKTGQAQLLFLDESALTIASNSDVVLDKFIYDPKTSKGELALSVGAGLFRFVGGRISKTAGVTIKTPTATIGIRGGIAIIKVAGTGKTRATWLFGKAMTVANIKTGETTTVTRAGFSVDVASPDDPPSSPFKAPAKEMEGNLTDLEGRTGQTAGLTEPLTDDQVADSGCCLPEDPENIVVDPTAAPPGTDGTDGGDLTLPPIPNLENEITETNPSSNPTPSPPTPTIFNSTFAGRFKTELSFGRGTADGGPEFDFSNASVVGGLDGILTETTTPLLLPTSGTPIAAPQGFTGFSIDVTDTSSPGGEFLEGDGFLSDDQAFIYYETVDGGESRNLTFAGIPTTSFPNSGITAYLLEPDFVLGSNVPFVRGVSGGDLTVAEPAPAAIDWGTGVFGGALVAIDGQGTDQTSAASLLVGSVVTGTQAEADLEGLMRGTTRDSSNQQPHLFDSAIELSRDGDFNAFFGADNPDYFVFQSDGGATDEFEGSTTFPYFPNVVAHVDTTETFGARTSRTLNGYSGGALQRIDSGVLVGSPSLFGNTRDMEGNPDPAAIQIDTFAASGTITAKFDVFASSVEKQIVASFGGTDVTDVSAFFDDESFGAIESSSIPTAVDGTPVDALLYMVTDVLETSDGFAAGVNFCQCEFLQWGFWGGDLDLGGGEHVRIHLANWVAGEISSLTDVMAEGGSADFSGHIIGTVRIAAGDIYQAVGGFDVENYVFATPTDNKAADFTVTQFDGVNYSGDLFAGGAGFTGSGDEVVSAGPPTKFINLDGAFFKGGDPVVPVAQVGGQFNINGSGYEASGIFAADQTSFTP